MPANLVTALSTALGIAAGNAGLTILSSEQGVDFDGRPTAIFRIGLCNNTSGDTPAEGTLRLELSDAFDFNRPELLPEMIVSCTRVLLLLPYAPPPPSCALLPLRVPL